MESGMGPCQLCLCVTQFSRLWVVCPGSWWTQPQVPRLLPRFSQPGVVTGRYWVMSHISKDVRVRWRRLELKMGAKKTKGSKGFL